ncbi:MAG: hypothetical protein U1F24_07725 [Alphaproteobacteria bacterium]
MSGLKRIHLELARDPQHPDGSPAIGYDIVAPLTADGHLDQTAWAAAPAACTVRHFANGFQERGLLKHGPTGWFFDYKAGQSDDEPVFKLDSHLLKAGEYVSVTEHNGKLMTFKVVSVGEV